MGGGLTAGGRDYLKLSNGGAFSAFTLSAFSALGIFGPKMLYYLSRERRGPRTPATPNTNVLSLNFILYIEKNQFSKENKTLITSGEFENCRFSSSIHKFINSIYNNKYIVLLNLKPETNKKT